MSNVNLNPLDNELPSEFADRLGVLYTERVDSQHKKRLGQFFTPSAMASFMAEFFNVKRRVIDILDPGTGTGVLACALIEYIVETSAHINEINLTAFETDDKIIPYTDLSLHYLSQWLKKREVDFRYYLCKNDFVLHNTKAVSSDFSEALYDVVISNPPYFKIPRNDQRSIIVKHILKGQSNIYTIFLVIAAKLLKPGGQLIFVTPRSFASGDYFKSFRSFFFKIVNINYLHLFSSRRKAFERDNVLQENIIVVARKKAATPNRQLSLIDENNMVQVSTSMGLMDIEERIVRNYRFEELVNMTSEQKILHIPFSTKESNVLNIFKEWRGSLEEYGIKISTGPVVDFRNKDLISVSSLPGYVPLIYLHNVEKMRFTWPLVKLAKMGKKGQYIRNSDEVKRLISNRDYILLRRFSSKDDHSRLIASPYFSCWLYEHSKIGIENHLNYIYRRDGDLQKEEIFGISGLLNSKLFDVYFRSFNGNTNVSATELRGMPFPPLKQIKQIGKLISLEKNLNEDIIDKIVSQTFKIHLTDE